MASGSAYFVYRLANSTAMPPNILPRAIPGDTEILLRAMENLYGLFGHGAAGAKEPSTGNASSVYTGSTAARGSAGPTNAA